jgi:hypothetical protein
MRADTAAAYVDEKSVDAFRRRVGKVCPGPRNICGWGRVWLKSDIDEAVAKLSGAKENIRDAADVL